MNYWDDFRVAFDYFFPGKLAPTAINIPVTMPGQWSTYTTGAIGPYTNVPVEVPGPLQNTIKYQTSGRLTIPLVNMHTTLDPIVPFWHQALYINKVRAKGSTANYSSISIGRYGHCSFYAEEMLLAFNRLLTNAGGPSMSAYLSALPNQASQERFKALVQQLGNARSVTVNDK